MSIDQEFHRVLDRSMQDITSRFAGIELMRDNVELSEDICTVHTILEGQRPMALLLCADTALLTRLAQNVMKRQEVTGRDIEDVATEYFNVVCGRVAAGLFQVAHIPSRFQTPRFHPGKFLPQVPVRCSHVLTYNGGNSGGVHLICAGLPPAGKKTPGYPGDP